MERGFPNCRHIRQGSDQRLYCKRTGKEVAAETCRNCGCKCKNG
nr:MAG TPA: hypothetical protein [Bacteriophage sp.]